MAEANIQDREGTEDNLFSTIWNSVIPDKLRFNRMLMDDFFKLLDNVFISARRESVPYHLPMLQHAYLYRYFTSITTAVKTSWNYVGIDPNDYVRAGKMRVTCIGGGPGCDLIGIQQWLKEAGIIIPIHGTIIDSSDWSDCTKVLFREMDKNNVFNLRNVQFKICDLFQTSFSSFSSFSSTLPINDIMAADIVTVIMFLSSVTSECRIENNVKAERLKGLLRHMRRGSLLHFMDTSEDRYTADLIMDRVAEHVGLECLYKMLDLEVEVAPCEAAAMKCAFMDMVPEKKRKIAISFMRKE